MRASPLPSIGARIFFGKMMRIIGPKEYTNLIDTKSVATFLRKHGASDKSIDCLEIKFVDNLLGSTLGFYLFGGRRIWIATWPVKQEGRSKKSLRGLNQTLLHELFHFCDCRQWHVVLPGMVQMLLLSLTAAAITYLLIRAINAFVSGIALQDITLGVMWVIVLPLTAKVLYRLSLFERRAREIEKSGPWLLRH